MTTDEFYQITEDLYKREENDMVAYLKMIGGEYCFKNPVWLPFEQWYLDDEVENFRVEKVSVLAETISDGIRNDIPAGSLMCWIRDEDGDLCYHHPDRPTLGSLTSLLEKIQREIAQNSSKAHKTYSYEE